MRNYDNTFTSQELLKMARVIDITASDFVQNENNAHVNFSNKDEFIAKIQEAVIDAGLFHGDLFDKFELDEKAERIKFRLGSICTFELTRKDSNKWRIVYSQPVGGES